MSKQIFKMYNKLEKLHSDAYELSNTLRDKVQQICDFEIDITYCQGDGVLILDIASANVCTFSALKDKNKKNKLKYNEFNKYSI